MGGQEAPGPEPFPGGDTRWGYYGLGVIPYGGLLLAAAYTSPGFNTFPTYLFDLNIGGSPILIGSLGQGSGARITWNFDSNPSTAQAYMILNARGTGLYYITASLSTPVQVGPQPVTNGVYQPLVPGVTTLDGTTYAMDDAGNIWGSNLNDPTTWDSLNFINAGQESDVGVCLMKQLTYIVALKSTTTQLFYDNGNASGSPLSPVPGAFIPYGCADANSVQQIESVIFWMTSNYMGTPQIIAMENLQTHIISTPAVDRLISSFLAIVAAPVGSPLRFFGNIQSSIFKRAGHRFYTITCISANLTLAYDIDNRMWYVWTDAAGNYWPVSNIAANQSTLVVQTIATGNHYYMDADYVYPNDYGNIIPVDIYTQNETFGVNRDKQLQAMYFDTDQQAGSNLKVRYSDNDYQTWTNFRTVDLSVPRPMIEDEGTFWRRAYHFRHAANTQLRLRSVDLQMDLCTL